MSAFNLVILMGNLTRDVELKFTPKGTAIAKFGLAINRKYRTESGDSKEDVCFVDIDCFGKQAETIAQYMRKGSKIHLTGRLKLDSWDDKATGQKRSRLGVVLESFQFIDSGDKQSALAPRAAAPSPTAPLTPEEKDDVPF